MRLARAVWYYLSRTGHAESGWKVIRNRMRDINKGERSDD